MKNLHMFTSSIFQCVALVTFWVHKSSGFVLTSWISNSNMPSRTRSSESFIKSETSTQLYQSSSDIFVLSFDGVVADTSEWRANLAIDAALMTWPHLNEYCNGDTEWLLNKVMALLPFTLGDENGMIGCDAVFLARLLLEEQLLDEGVSNGCKGKYGSKFHPSSKASGDTGGKSSSTQGSRPLTVGEISANWNDGACLKDTVRIKYNIDKKDPIPFVKENIKYCLKEESELSPYLYPSIFEALLDCSSRVYVLVGDESHVPTAMSSLSNLSLPLKSMKCDELVNNSECGIIIVAGAEGHTVALERIMMLERGSSVHVIHSDVATLREAKTFFGDNRPRHGMFEESESIDVSLKLSLSSMSTGPQQLNEATMDPWLNVIDEFELVETLSAQIISK